MKSMKNNDLLSIDELIAELKEKKIDLGKGDPYNRLRYYTKIGWLPNMLRRANKDGEVLGHYPSSVVEMIKLINQYKAEGLSNEEIGKRLSSQKRVMTVQTLVGSENIKSTLIIVGLAALLIGAILYQRPPQEYASIESFGTPTQNIPNIILQSGSFYMPRGRSEIFINTDSNVSVSKIYVTFEGDYKPAQRYWVEKNTTGAGFYVKLDAPVVADTAFSWWLTN